MRRRFSLFGCLGWLWLGWLLPLGLAAQTAPAETVSEEAGRVVVVANRQDPEAEPLARYYLRRRGIPEANLCLLDMGVGETTTWPEFVAGVWNPLLRWLADHHWLEGPLAPEPDAQGRLRPSRPGHRMSYLVLVRGLPLRLHDDAPGAGEVGNLPAAFHTTAASADGELVLLAAHPQPVRGAVNNPLYRVRFPRREVAAQFVRVARLDGPSAGAVKGLIDSALAGEAKGLRGRWYVDRQGPHATGDAWLEAVAARGRTLGFDVAYENTPDRLSAAHRADAMAVYFGWYVEHVDGPFVLPGFRFPPGAIAVHLHSFSAASLGDAQRYWVGPLVARGAAFTVGNTWEPYLELTHRLDLLAEALAWGATTGEAAAYAQPALSWMAVAVGDPLYRPFRRPLADQLAVPTRDADRFTSYAWLRQVRLTAQNPTAGGPTAALAEARRGFERAPGLALALALAELLQQAGAPATEIADTLEIVAGVSRLAPDEWALAAVVATQLEALGRGEAAARLRRALANTPFAAPEAPAEAPATR